MQVPPFGGGQGSGCPPESHKSFLKATASSLHCLNWLLISSAHPNATDAKNSPPPPSCRPASPAPQPHGNQQRVAGRDLEFYSHHSLSEKGVQAGRQAGIDHGWSGNLTSRKAKG